MLTAARTCSPRLSFLMISGDFRQITVARVEAVLPICGWHADSVAARTLAKPFEWADPLEAVTACLAERGQDPAMGKRQSETAVIVPAHAPSARASST